MLVGGPRPVGVLYAQHQLASAAAGEGHVEQGDVGGADVGGLRSARGLCGGGWLARFGCLGGRWSGMGCICQEDTSRSKMSLSRQVITVEEQARRVPAENTGRRPPDDLDPGPTGKNRTGNSIDRTCKRSSVCCRSPCGALSALAESSKRSLFLLYCGKHLPTKGGKNDHPQEG